MAALLTLETGNTAKVVKLHQRGAARMGITILPPDVNTRTELHARDGRGRADGQRAGQRHGIRFGLGAVKEPGQSAVEAIARRARRWGHFSSLHQFCEKVGPGCQQTGA